MRRYMPGVFALVLTSGSAYAAKQLQIAPGEVICRDQQRAFEYVRRHADFAPDPAFQCWPLAPSAQVFELKDVVPNVRGRRMVAVHVVQPNFAAFIGYAFVAISKAPQPIADPAPVPAPAVVPGISSNPTAPSAPAKSATEPAIPATKKAQMPPDLVGDWSLDRDDCTDKEGGTLLYVRPAEIGWYEIICGYSNVQTTGAGVQLGAQCEKGGGTRAKTIITIRRINKQAINVLVSGMDNFNEVFFACKEPGGRGSPIIAGVPGLPKAASANAVSRAESTEPQPLTGEQAAEKGDPEAQYKMGLKYEEEQKYAEAISWYRKAKTPEAIARIGNIRASQKTIVPVESDATIYEKWEGNVNMLNLAVNIVRANDYKCDSISVLTPFIFLGLGCTCFAISPDTTTKSKTKAATRLSPSSDLTTTASTEAGSMIDENGPDCHPSRSKLTKRYAARKPHTARGVACHVFNAFQSKETNTV
jgi:hypothetical protein